MVTSAPPTNKLDTVLASTASKYPCVVVKNTKGASFSRTEASITP